ncbi:ABC transporter ATP-binding protein [Fodinisporobacter ferrooxydans]|uniref:ABC transporter ATP-binding protein n=1 Tax=Fodinisporobacter ferrooxydans TaxID=2901836 RepID=A0ABY4CK96_9BACL|nr:ABC transporter ATP-binding protein [Alicyclobacillaceae bacterium MYW30-H2]
MNQCVHIKGICKHYGKVEALRQIDLSIMDGEFVALLGPSGCGKTTLLRLIAGFDQPNDGEIWLHGERVATKFSIKPPEFRQIGMVFQSFALWPHMNVYENVVFPLHYQPNVLEEYKRNIRKRVQEILELVGLGGFEKRFPSQLSGGQRQRVAVARAIVFNPALLLMDEPLSSLDAELRIQMRKEIQDIHRNLGTAIIYVTHDQSEALAMANRVVVMKEGAIEQVGSPNEIYFSPKTPFVAKFVGQSNFLKGEWLDSRTFSIHFNNQNPVVINTKQNFQPFQNDNILPIRPDQIQLRKLRNQYSKNGLLGKVRHIQFQGRELMYSVQVEEYQLEIMTNTYTHFEYGEDVEVELLV